MTQPRPLVVSIQGRRRRPDLVLTLALLGRAVRAHRRVQRLAHALAGSGHAKPLGA
jgi:hypothetical protein